MTFKIYPAFEALGCQHLHCLGSSLSTAVSSLTGPVAHAPGVLVYLPRETASSEVRGEGRDPLADKAGESTLLSRSGGEKGLMPGESLGRRSLVGCRLWGRTESDTTEAT